MAADDNDAAEPVSAMRPAVQTAVLIGLDASAIETLTLLLEILGWAVVSVSQIEQLPDRPPQLVFVDDTLFMNAAMGSEAKIAKCRTIVLVGLPSSTSFIGADDARIYRVGLPLDIGLLEDIIASAV